MSPGDILDVAIVGAGISGINTAYRLQTSLPSATYTILESRASLGGTWSLFNYPGVRSDSNLWTFGFAWRPWSRLESIASGASILSYLRDSASYARIDSKIQYNHKLSSATWSSETQTWTLSTTTAAGNKTIHIRFLIMCTGYYDYTTPQVSIPGLSRFSGQVIHPQSWPSAPPTPPLTPSPSSPASETGTPPSPLYASKRITLIGSGATSITLLPALARSATHVTMIQRSPSYVASIPAVDPSIPTLRRWLPIWLSSRLIRFKYLLLDTVLMQFSKRLPEKAKAVLLAATSEELKGSKVDVKPHFEPKYMPGQQRLCLCPDGDFFAALREEKGSVVTGLIDSVEENGVRMQSGEFVDADVIVTATGLNLMMGGGVEISVDGEIAKLGERYLWNTVMLSGVPNLAVVLDFANASWTLGVDAAAVVILRVLKMMWRRKIGAAIPRLEESRREEEMGVEGKEGEGQGRKKLWAFNLTSTYVVKGRDQLPRTLERAPWQPRGTYLWNWWVARFGSIEREMEFVRLKSS